MWSKSGVKIASTTYKDGLIDGLDVAYSGENGRKISEHLYKDGVRQ